MSVLVYHLPPRLIEDIRSRPHSEPVLTPFRDDIWFTDGCVPLHNDGPLEKAVYILVLINDNGLLLAHHDTVREMPVGSIHRVLGHEPHGALWNEYDTVGRFAFLAWDVPRNDLRRYEAWPDFAVEVQKALDAYESVGTI